MENQLQVIPVGGQTAVTIRRQGNTFLLTDLKEELTDLKDDELKIIEARQKGKALCDLSGDEFDAALTGIIFNISVICGCQLPTHDVHVNALEKEFTIYLKEYGYYELTPEEILTAFRMNSNFQLEEKIETYQAIFNLDFAGKVLTQYINKRWSLDYKLLQLCQKTTFDKIFEEDSNKRRIKIKEQFAKYVADDKVELDLANCYMQLIEDRAFSDHDLYKTFYKSTIISERRSHAKEAPLDEFPPIKEFIKSYDANLDEMFEAQRRATKYLFEEMKKSGRLEIYSDDLQLLHPGFTIEQQEKIKADI